MSRTKKDGHGPRTEPYKPIRTEAVFFLGLLGFFIPIFVIYGLWSGWESVGSTALALVAGLWAMVGFYLFLLSRRIDPRPEDDPSADIDAAAGEYGTFSPWSWWPLLLGIAVAFVFLGVAVGWWLFGIGVAIAVIGLVGHVLEFSRGPHAH